jgi:hypothetical protein
MQSKAIVRNAFPRGYTWKNSVFVVILRTQGLYSSAKKHRDALHLSKDVATGTGISKHTTLSISGPVRDTALSAAASRPNSSPKMAVEKRMAVAIERVGWQTTCATGP